MKKKCFSILTVLIIACIFVSANSEHTDAAASVYRKEELEKLSIEELLSLKTLITDVLSEKGYVLYRDLSHGDKGDDIIKLQEALKDSGFYNGNINGKFDTATEKAVKSFQKANGLKGTGVATQETQMVLFSGNAEIKTTASPKPTSVPTPTPDPKYADYSDLDYKEYSRYPSRHYGEKVKLEGKVIQVANGYLGSTVIRLALTGNSENIVYLEIGKDLGLDFKILENDRLIIYGTMIGMKTYSAIFGNEVTIPHAQAEYVILK